MDFELLGNVGWREGLILVIVLLLAYIVVLFLRMRRLQNERGVSALPPLLAQSALAAYTGIQEADAAVPATPAPAAAEIKEASDSGVAAEPASAAAAAAAAAVPPVAAEELDFAWNEAPPEIPGQALIEALQEDVYHLRCAVDELRDELHNDLREGLLAAREDFRHQLLEISQIAESSAQAASPLYNDAMQMAAQGQDAATIAQHCGIARAEADLVVALVRNRNDGS
ncbi:MAG: DUF2802 domain-containing protein [Candidatus Accumulibacter phosphatis]|uniref:DUF2802 domain-containing protein n=1 Tax=Candidatus Accumulibacter sp. ACC012 TaxID=2823332 RepID=UPI0025B8B4C9|nr:DUF2802 domain-containing protein [Candidatus Accumulibacter sp. ACC012]